MKKMLMKFPIITDSYENLSIRNMLLHLKVTEGKVKLEAIIKVIEELLLMQKLL